MSGIGAQFSDGRLYRYALWRTWEEGRGSAMFIGLNPSTADEKLDDPTVRRCKEFARRWGFGGLYMLNIYAYRSTDPKGLLKVSDPVGPKNNEFLAMYAGAAGVVVAAWGAFEFAQKRALEVEAVLKQPLWCFGLTKSGAPRHPLYLAYSNKLTRWRSTHA